LARPEVKFRRRNARGALGHPEQLRGPLSALQDDDGGKNLRRARRRQRQVGVPLIQNLSGVGIDEESYSGCDSPLDRIGPCRRDGESNQGKEEEEEEKMLLVAFQNAGSSLGPYSVENLSIFLPL
jgi:hypothetical protein